jgi:hypothetical protein
VLAILLVPFVWLGRRRRWVLAATALGSFTAASLWVSATQTTVRSSWTGGFGTPATIASVVAVIAVAASLLVERDAAAERDDE